MASSIFGQPPTFQTNYVAHAGQEEISLELEKNFLSETPAAIIEIIAGRGWGKTLYFVCEILCPYLDQNANAKVMWVAPTYSVAMTPIDDVFKGVDERTGEKFVPEFDAAGNRVWEFVTTKSGPILRWWNGATVFFKSADAPDTIVSKGFNLIVIDEAALIQEQVFTQQILGTARKQGIKIFMITTPRGKRHWTYKIFLKGQSAEETQYLSFQQAYDKNPFYNKTLAMLIKDIPDWLYRQEYKAEFVDDGDCVFRGLESVFDGPEVNFESSQQEWRKPITDTVVKTFDTEVKRAASERTFCVSLDLAKSIDYTVAIVMDVETGEVVYYRRINKEDYRNILSMCEKLSLEYNGAELIFDSTGVGQGLADIFNNYNIISHPFHFTNDSKVELINRLIVSIEYGEIKIPNIVTIKNELSVFTYTLTRTGKISYNAPAGFHDDIVIAIALANWYRKEESGREHLGVIEDIINHNAGRRPDEGRQIEEMFGDTDD